MINADAFAYTDSIYFNEFLNVLKLMNDSYNRIIRLESFGKNEFETFLRNVLVKKYLRVNKEIINKEIKEQLVQVYNKIRWWASW